MKLPLLALLTLAASAPAWSAPVQPAYPSGGSREALPSGLKATLHFAREKVAVGGIPDAAHQSEFWIEVRDARNKPQPGVAVDLPVITKGGQGAHPTDKAPDNSIKARLEWLPATARVKRGAQALTNRDGRAYGRFTSGLRTQKVEFSLVGGAKAAILQTWNEIEEPFDDSGYSDESPAQLRYTMRFFEAGHWVPITSHHLDLESDQVRLALTDISRGPDEDGDGQPDGETEIVTFSQEKPETEGWKAWKQWSKFSKLTETEPGIYMGQYEVHVPEDAVIDGRRVEYVDDVHYWAYDNDAWDDE